MYRKLSTLLFFIAFSMAGKASVLITDLAPDSSMTFPSRSSGAAWFSIDFNHDATEDYNFSWYFTRFSGKNVCCYGPSVNEISSTGVSPLGAAIIAAIDSGVLIDASHSWADAAASPQPRIYEAGGTDAFVDSGTKYIGVRFQVGTDTHYGWIKVSYTSANTFTVMSYGYETIPFTGLPAGSPSGLPAPPAPVADFSSATTSTDTKTAVTFNDASLNSPTSWQWSVSPATVTFMGGSSATSRNPQILFGAAGKYTVKLKASNTGGSDSIVKTDYMVVTAVPGPIANFTASATSTDTKTTITFTDASANAPTSWQWTFTPPTVTFMSGTSATSQNPQVQFTATGKYTVKLKATNVNGSDSATKTDYITVQTPTGIITYEPGDELLAVFPNPAHSSLTIHTPGEGTLSLLDISGKTAWSAPASNTIQLLDISRLPKGYYTLRFSGERGELNKKLILQ
ncbi:MAG: T9SS type A sorting domain-containing protein [Chitinophagaceae bacterium]|nr:T9SS type A sorting domain-containing protein [Chitinophagaceae bacterium]